MQDENECTDLTTGSDDYRDQDVLAVLDTYTFRCTLSTNTGRSDNPVAFDVSAHNNSAINRSMMYSISFGKLLRHALRQKIDGAVKI